VPNAETGELEWHAADGTVMSAQEWEANTGAVEVEVEVSPADMAPEEAEQASPAAVEAALEGEEQAQAALEAEGGSVITDEDTPESVEDSAPADAEVGDG
jgi:N utilization substance protein A